MTENIVEKTRTEYKKKQKEAKIVKKAQTIESIKTFSNTAYRASVSFILETALSAFAIIGIMSVINASRNISTGLAVFVVALILIAKFNNKK